MDNSHYKEFENVNLNERGIMKVKHLIKKLERAELRRSIRENAIKKSDCPRVQPCVKSLAPITIIRQTNRKVKYFVYNRLLCLVFMV
jgi:hypothetical protein